MPPRLALRSRGESLRPDRVQDELAVPGTVGLQHELDRRLAHVELDALTNVLDVDDVGAMLRDDPQQRRECPGSVGDDGPHDESPSRSRLAEPDAFRETR